MREPIVPAVACDGQKNVYVGGAFILAGDDVEVNCVAKWDGGQWSALGTGMNSYVSSLAFGADGRLYAAGGFTKAGASPPAVWRSGTARAGAIRSERAPIPKSRAF